MSSITVYSGKISLILTLIPSKLVLYTVPVIAWVAMKFAITNTTRMLLQVNIVLAIGIASN